MSEAWNVSVLDNMELGGLSAQLLPQDKYLHCYQCLLETQELGCLLGSDTCLIPLGSSCFTLHIKNSKWTPPPPRPLPVSYAIHQALFPLP